MLPNARAGNIDVLLGLLLGVGLCLGAQLAQWFPVLLLQRGFAVVLILLAARMLLQR